MRSTTAGGLRQKNTEIVKNILQMGVFTDGNGIPLAFSLFPGNQNGYKSLKSLENSE